MAMYATIIFLFGIATAPVLASDDTCGNMDYEVRIKKLEALVNALSTRLVHAEAKNIELEAEQSAIHKLTTSCIAKASKNWALQRVDAVFPNLKKIQLHQKSPTYLEKLPAQVPANTKAIILSIFCNFWNNGGHAYLNADIHQKGNDKSGQAKITNTHFRVYANTFYYEIMLPWDTKLTNEIVFKVTSSYNTGGPNNFYQIKLVGYISS